MTFQRFFNAILNRTKKLRRIKYLPGYLKRFYYWNKRHDLYLPIQAFGCSNKVYKFQNAYSFSKNIKFSILVPLYNTPEKFLLEMIGSVIFQTYENWELCLADGSDSEHDYIEKICNEIIKTEKRIKYTKLKSNKGISENTNECIKMATGDYISLFDHDDLLHPYALFETMKAICDKNADFVYTDEAIFQSPYLPKIRNTNFKPDFSPDYFHSTNYLCHFSSFKSSLLSKAGLFNSKTDGAQDYDLFLRLSEHTGNIIHVPKCLYYWRASPTSTASGIQTKTYAIEAGKLALQDHYKRCSIKAVVSTDKSILYKTSYLISKTPLISIIIINKNTKQLIECIKSIKKHTTYNNFEIIIIKKDSSPNLFNELSIKELNWSNSINYAAMNNFGVNNSKGEILLFLDCYTRVITDNWLSEMLMFAQRKETGIVGAKILNMNNTIYNAGYILGTKKIFQISHYKWPANENGYAFRAATVQNFNAVSAECMMITKELFFKYGGFSEQYTKSFYDIDLCIRLRKDNYLIIWTPFAELYYSNKIGYHNNISEKAIIKQVISQLISQNDPYYNPNLSNTKSFEISGSLFPN